MGSYIDVLPNYTGPYISNGEFQTSIEFGDKPPKDKLDALSRLHDTAYAHFDDYGHRRAADAIYARDAAKLVGLFPELAGFVVKYGNHTLNSAGNLYNNWGWLLGPLGGLLVGGVKNATQLHDYMLNENKYKKDVTQLYATDPIDFRRGQSMNSGAAVNSNPLGKPTSGKTSTGESVRQGQSSSGGVVNVPLVPHPPPPRPKQPGLNERSNTNATEYNPYKNLMFKSAGRRRRKKNKNKIYIYS